MRWYWFRFKRNVVPVTVYLPERAHYFLWSNIQGVQIGAWFIGVIRGVGAEPPSISGTGAP